MSRKRATSSVGDSAAQASDPSPPSVASPATRNPEELINAWAAEMAARQGRINEELDALRSLEPEPRAAGWLQLVLRHRDRYGEEEALVYLASRGHDVTPATEAVLAHWRRDEARAIEDATRATVTFRIDGSHSEGALTTGQIAASIQEIAHATLRDFWSPVTHSAFDVVPTLLRAVEWCDVGGLEPWWARYGRDKLDEALEGGLEPTALAYTLFAVARSPLAMELSSRAWLRNLDVVERGVGRREPWLHLYHGETFPEAREQFAFASCLAFATARLRGAAVDVGLVERIASMLVARQREDGGWSTWAGHTVSEPTATALAVHALSVSTTRGRDRAMQRAASYLWSAQDALGFWDEPAGGATAPMLTVLALDAIALANGTTTTLDPARGGRPNIAGAPARPGVRSTHARDVAGVSRRMRFDVGFSFPGEHRTRVKTIADAMADTFGHERVLYDNYLDAELARVDLDVYLQHLYRFETRVIVVVLCSDYERKRWCRLEWRAVRDLINHRAGDVMFLRADDGEVPGVFTSVDGHVDMREFDDAQLIDKVRRRVQATLAG